MITASIKPDANSVFWLLNSSNKSTGLTVLISKQIHSVLRNRIKNKMHIKTSGLFQVFQNLVSHQKHKRDINRFHVLLNVFIWFGKLPAHGAKYPSILSNYECRAPANTTRSKCSKKKKKKK